MYFTYQVRMLLEVYSLLNSIKMAAPSRIISDESVDEFVQNEGSELDSDSESGIIMLFKVLPMVTTQE